MPPKMTITPLIKYVSNLVDISDSDTKLLSHFFKPTNFSKGTIIEEEDVVAQNLYFVTNGFVRSFFYSDGIETTTQIIISQNQQRTTDFITLSAEKRYLKLMKEQPEIIQNVPIQYIASYIGIKPESLSRIRKKIIF